MVENIQKMGKSENFSQSGKNLKQNKSRHKVFLVLGLLCITLVLTALLLNLSNNPNNDNILETEHKRATLKTEMPILPVGSFDPEDTRDIGYEFLDGGDVVHIWNTVDDYFFDTDSGIQFTNHYEDYWTKNIFCLGYYNNEVWNKINCADELSNFNKSIETDNSTYVNATLWKDITYSGYEMRLGIVYELNLNDPNLSIHVYGKNIDDEVYPFDIGFAWKITDWEIPHDTPEGDGIFVNRTDYFLDETFDVTFTNMSHIISNETDEEILVWDNIFRGYDYTEFLDIGWSEKLDYKVRIVGNGNQEDFYTIIMINASRFNVGQEKSTVFTWIDAEGDYTNVYWDVDEDMAGRPRGVEVISNASGNYAYVVDGASNDIYIYKLGANGNATEKVGQWAIAEGNDLYDMTTDGNYMWLLEQDSSDVLHYHMNHSFSRSSKVNHICPSCIGIGTNGSRIWVSSATEKTVAEMNMTANSTDYNFTINEASTLGAIDGYSSTVFIGDYGDGNSSWGKYNGGNGSQEGWFNCDGNGHRCQGVGFNIEMNDYLLVADPYTYDIYVYESGVPEPPSPPDVTINTPENTTYSSSSIEFNVTAIDDVSLDSCWITIDGGVSNNTMYNLSTDDYNYTNASVVEGEYLAEFYCNDSSNDINDTESISFSIDLTNPEINITYPLNNTSYTSNTLSINYTYTEINSDTCWYSNDTFSENTSLASCGTNITDVTWSEGNHNVTVWINDSLNNVNESSVTFNIDSIFPNINITYPENNTNFTINTVSVNYTYSDANVDSCWYSNDSLDLNTTITCGTNVTDIVWTDGGHTVIVWINDTYNNVNQTSIVFNVDTTLPGLNIIYPTNDTNHTTNTLSVNYTYTEANPDTCWYSNDTYAENTTITCGENITDVTWSEGLHDVKLWLNDTSDNINQSAITFWIDSIVPDIEIVYPTNYSNFTINTVSVNYTYADVNLDSCWYSNDSYSENTSISCGTNITDILWDDGLQHNVTIWINDSSNNVNESYVIFGVDTTNPSVSFTSPNLTVNLINNFDNFTLNVTLEDLSGLDTCIYEYDGVNTTEPCTGTSYEILKNVTYINGVNNITLFANDSYGNVNITFYSWSTLLIINNISYTNYVYETATEAFTINLSTSPNVSSISTKLWYNGTSYSATTPEAVSDVYEISRSIDIPLVDNSNNVTFLWELNYVLTDDTEINQNTSEYSHAVNRTFLSYCNATYDVGFVNFTTKNAFSPFPEVNATFKSSWNFWLGNGTVFRNYTYEDTNENITNFDFCMYPADKNYTVNSAIEIDSTGFSQNYHYLTESILSNVTNNISLYLLNDSDATLTVLHVRDQAQQPIGEVYIQIQLYDIGTETYYTTAMAKTAFNGEDLVYLNWYDSFYKFILTKNGTVLETTSPYKISETPQIFEIGDATNFTYDKFEDFIYSLYYNNATSNFVLTFTKPSGDVDSGCLRVYRRNAANDTLVCHKCATSSSATLFCDISDEGNGTFYATFYATGSLSRVATIVTLVGHVDEIYDLIGNVDGSIYAFLFAGVIVGMFLIHPIFAVVGIMLGVTGAMIMGFQPLYVVEFVGFIIGGFVIIWLIKR